MEGSKSLRLNCDWKICASFLVFNLISINMSMLTPVFKIHWITARTSLQMCWPHKSFSAKHITRDWQRNTVMPPHDNILVEGKLSFDVLKPQGQVVLPKVQKFDRGLKNHWWTNRRRLSAGSTTCSCQGQQYGSCSSKPFCCHQAQVQTDNYFWPKSHLYWGNCTVIYNHVWYDLDVQCSGVQ